MSDPRITPTATDEAGALVKRYKYDSEIVYSSTADGGSASVGLAVKGSGNDGEVTLTTDASRVLGKLLNVEYDGWCSVQVRGEMTLPGGNGASLTIGKAIVGALGASSAKGYIREVATAVAAELGVMGGVILENDTTTAVVVAL